MCKLKTCFLSISHCCCGCAFIHNNESTCRAHLITTKSNKITQEILLSLGNVFFCQTIYLQVKKAKQTPVTTCMPYNWRGPSHVQAKLDRKYVARKGLTTRIKRTTTLAKFK